MKRAALLVPFFLMLCAVVAKADQVGPTWDISAAGIFSAGGPASEAFALNWTLTFQSFGPDFVMPLWSGTTVFTGVLGTFTATMSNAFTNVADGGYIGFLDPQGDLIEINVSDYTVIPSAQAITTPTIFAPDLYSCNVSSICEAYGTHVQSAGLFAGFGPITQTARQVPEPGTLLLLIAGAATVRVKRLAASKL
jgi:hypothetical protein